VNGDQVLQVRERVEDDWKQKIPLKQKEQAERKSSIALPTAATVKVTSIQKQGKNPLPWRQDPLGHE
jgi:hypothetical protein